jgi:cellulose synthase (UDP-forming)
MFWRHQPQKEYNREEHIRELRTHAYRKNEPVIVRHAIPLKLFLLIGVLWLTVYVVCRIRYINLAPAVAVFSIILFLAECHNLFHLYGMFYSLWPRRYMEYEKLNESRDLRINMFVCVCGEPPDIIRETIKAAMECGRVYEEIVNPIHAPRVVVLNDGKVARKDNWYDIQEICEELGVKHVARTVPGGFKAGNINNGLKETPTDDPHNTLDIIFDSDFAAKPEFLVEITKPFVDATIDFVQSPQRYKNMKTWVAKAAAAHQIFFFDHICRAKGHDNSLFLCGTNFAIRRSALDAVGGIDTKFITEDYTTSLNLHLLGRKGIFMPKVLALGVAPSSLKQYFTQQQRWSKGNFDVTQHYMKQLLFGPLTWKQKMHYILSATYYLIGLRDFILMLAPVPYLFFGVSLIKANTMTYLMGIYFPLLVYNFCLYTTLFRFPIKSLVLDMVSFPIFTFSFFSSVLKKDLAFIVTIKKYEKENPFAVYRIQMAVGVLLAIGLIYNWSRHVNHGMGNFINCFWATFNVVFLTVGFLLIVHENYFWGVWDVLSSENPFSRRRGVQLVRAIPAFAWAVASFMPRMLFAFYSAVLGWLWLLFGTMLGAVADGVSGSFELSLNPFRRQVFRTWRNEK